MTNELEMSNFRIFASLHKISSLTGPQKFLEMYAVLREALTFRYVDTKPTLEPNGGTLQEFASLAADVGKIVGITPIEIETYNEKVSTAANYYFFKQISEQVRRDNGISQSERFERNIHQLKALKGKYDVMYVIGESADYLLSKLSIIATHV